MTRDGPGTTCFNCGSPATERFGNSYICEDCTPTAAGSPRSGSPDATPGGEPDASASTTATTVPEAFHGLGEIAFPIPPRQKAADRPRTEEYLYAPEDDVIAAYLEAGHNYGLSCRDDLAYLDADDPDALAPVIDALPETAWQVTGSREGRHYFLLVPGLDEDLPLVDPDTGENVGHVKAAEQSYVVAPGSIHPSGNRYGPLHGDDLATVDEADLRELVEPFRPGTPEERSRDSSSEEFERPPAGDDPTLSVYDVLSAGRHPEETRCEHPFHGSDTGANFMVDDGGETWRCWRHDCTGNALHLVGIEQGIIDCGEWDPVGLDSDIWSKIFDKAREAGYDLPDYEPSADEDHVAVLPPAVRNVWDWQDTGDECSMADARDTCQNTLEAALRGSNDVLVEALPTLGKSSGAVRAAAATGEAVTILTGRGRKEMYDQYREWALEHGLVPYTLPAFTHDCTTANGEHGDDWRERVLDWYRRGATPQDIHKYAETELGRPLPCQAGEHACPYAAAWDFDPDDYDVLIGHYAHAHKPKVTSGRTVVVDEFPSGAYETTLEHALAGAVTAFLQDVDALPFDDHAALLEGIAAEHGDDPALITTATAEDEYRSAGLLETLVDDHAHYGNVLGSNEFKHTRLGAVIGSQHYGDRYVEKWGAYDGEAVARGDEKGADLTYGSVGDEILTHMREHEVLQAVMRFGRDGHGATVYVHTGALPEWVPVAGEGRVISTRSEGMKQVLEAASGRVEWTTAELATDPVVEIGERQVRKHLHALVEDGYLDVAIEGGGYVWRDTGLHRVSEHGEVELDPVDVDDLGAEASAELARSSIYTRNFRTSVSDPTEGGRDVASRDAAVDATVANGGDRPPDAPD